MIKITSVHIVQTAETENYIILLLDQPNRRVVPIWTASEDGLQVMLLLRQVSITRPWSFSVMNQILNTLGSTIQDVQIQPFPDESLYGVIRVHDGKEIHEFEARASNAIALALYSQVPIVVAEDVMSSQAVPLPDSFDELAWLQKETYSLAELEQLYGLMDEWQKRKHDGIDRFTKRARRTFASAQAEALRLNHNYVGTEHLLLGMMLDDEGVGAKVLRELGVKKTEVVAAVEGVKAGKRKNGATSSDQPLPIAPRTGKVIELAAEERRILGHRYIGTEHLLIGIVREDRGQAANILRDLGLNVGQVRPQIIEKIVESLPRVTG